MTELSDCRISVGSLSDISVGLSYQGSESAKEADAKNALEESSSDDDDDDDGGLGGAPVAPTDRVLFWFSCRPEIGGTIAEAQRDIFTQQHPAPPARVYARWSRTSQR